MMPPHLSRRQFATACGSALLLKRIALGRQAAPAARSTFIPKSAAPARELFALRIGDITTEAADMQLTLYSLQGLVNRKQPVLYIAQDRYDELWLDWMRERGDIDRVHWLEIGDVFERFLPFAECMFITDPAIPATANVATMLASVHNGLVATPATFRQYDLPSGAYPDSSKVGLDLRTMNWKKDVEAYRWAFREIGAKLTDRVVAVIDPGSHPLRDYVVQFRIPVLWISSPRDASTNPQASFDEEYQFARQVLMRMPPNIPAIGWPGDSPGREQGIGEWPGVRLLSECGKIEICSGYDGYSPAMSNLSVHSGTKATFKQTRTPPPSLDKNRIYCAFIRSDGDGLNFQRHYYRKLFDDPTHGKVPMGWQIGPTAADFIPDILDYYYKHARPGDCFVNALSGVGYIHEDNFADNYPPQEKEAIWREFLTLSENYMERMDAHCLTTFAEMQPEILAKLTGMKPVQAVFANYGRTHATKQSNLLTFVEGKPVFRALNTAPPTLCYTPSARANAEAMIVEQVRRWTPSERPAFLYIFLANWLTDIDMAFNIARQLGPNYTFVTPNHLAELSEAAKRS